MNILVVDDSPDVLSWLTAVLRLDGWTVFPANDAGAACDLLSSKDIRVVITDWMMPGMDGLSLIENIRNRDSGRYVYTLLMTGRDSEEDCIRGLRSGADDYLVKPVSPGVLKARLKTARRIVEMQQELLDQQLRLRESRRMVTSALAGVRRELDQAASQQREGLPAGLQLPPGVVADWRFRPASSLSGDHLNFFLTGRDHLAFYLLDVSGHGVGAALRSAALSELLRPFSGVMLGLDTEGPHRVLEQLNRHICGSSEEVEYLATIVLGLLDTQSGAVRIAAAGHPSPLLVRTTGEVNAITGAGLPLGVSSEASFETRGDVLEPGDFLLLYSDGALDCRNPKGEPFGGEALLQQARAGARHPPGEVIRLIEGRLDRWRGPQSLEDDVSLLALGRRPQARGSAAVELPSAHYGLQS